MPTGGRKVLRLRKHSAQDDSSFSRPCFPWNTPANSTLDDSLKGLRSHFHALPAGQIYLDGNSLGLLPLAAEASVQRALDAWKTLAIGGWLDAAPPWFTLAERLAARVAPLVGAEPGEVAVANSTTVNLHQLLGTLYDPAATTTARKSWPSPTSFRPTSTPSPATCADADSTPPIT